MDKNFEVEINFFTNDDTNTPYEQITYTVKEYDEDEAESKALQLAKESSSYYHDSYCDVNEINRIFNSTYEMTVDFYEADDSEEVESIFDTKSFIIHADSFDEADEILNSKLENDNIDCSFYELNRYKKIK